MSGKAPRPEFYLEIIDHPELLSEGKKRRMVQVGGSSKYYHFHSEEERISENLHACICRDPIKHQGTVLGFKSRNTSCVTNTHIPFGSENWRVLYLWRWTKQSGVFKSSAWLMSFVLVPSRIMIGGHTSVQADFHLCIVLNYYLSSLWKASDVGPVSTWETKTSHYIFIVSILDQIWRNGEWVKHIAPDRYSSTNQVTRCCFFYSYCM